VTIPNGRAPAEEQPGPNHHGNGELFTFLSVNGIVAGIGRDGQRTATPAELRVAGLTDADVRDALVSNDVGPDGSVAIKFPWWRGTGVVGPLRIQGRRLDRKDDLLRAEIPNARNTGFEATTVIFPGAGCWQIVATAGRGSLRVVVLVVNAVPRRPRAA
jgi:hypothetical protein